MVEMIESQIRKTIFFKSRIWLLGILIFYLVSFKIDMHYNIDEKILNTTNMTKYQSQCTVHT